MFDRTALQAFRNSLTENVAGLTGPEASAALAQRAVVERDRVLGQAVSRTNAQPSYRQIVDGIEAAALEAVKPDGVIVFEWFYLREAVEETFALLVGRSPRDQGGYIAGLRILVDQVQGTLDDITAETRTVDIVATTPYARRLEVGRRFSGGYFVLQVKPHIVEETAMVARRLFGRIATVWHGYVELDDAYVLKGRLYGTYYTNRRGNLRSRSGRQARGQRMKYPAIQFEALR